MSASMRNVDADHELDLAERILNTALLLGEERGWQTVELTQVAHQLGLPAHRILDHYRDLDAVANAWFQRGLKAMLDEKPENFVMWSGKERFEYCLFAWFDALASHHQVTVEMLHTKVHAPHPHTWVPMVFDLSRLIQWLRQAAALSAPYGSRRAQLEEVALTGLFLATLRAWSRDTSMGQESTRQSLARRLSLAERFMRLA
nr:hypothetical protein [uncultured Halomonas sp.]